MPARRLVWGGLLAALLIGALGAAGGFVIGYKWPIETVEQWLGLERASAPEPWAEIATTDLPRFEPVGVQIDRTLYVFGGFYGNRIEATARVEALDLDTGSWTRLTDMPVPVTHAGAASVRDTVWIAGGFEGDNPGPVTNKVWRYAAQSDSWSQGPPLPEARGSGALVARGDTLHYFGGYHPDRATNSSDHWRLVIGQDDWVPAAPFPDPRGHFAAALVGGRIYAIAGTLGHDPVPTDVDHVHAYDPETDRWTEMPSTPFPTSHSEPGTRP